MLASTEPRPYIETVSDATLCDGWRHAMASVDRFLEFVDRDPAFYLPRYIEAVRTVSEDEAEMERRGIEYEVSPDHWNYK